MSPSEFLQHAARASRRIWDCAERYFTEHDFGRARQLRQTRAEGANDPVRLGAMEVERLEDRNMLTAISPVEDLSPPDVTEIHVAHIADGMRVTLHAASEIDIDRLTQIGAVQLVASGGDGRFDNGNETDYSSWIENIDHLEEHEHEGEVEQGHGFGVQFDIICSHDDTYVLVLPDAVRDMEGNLLGETARRFEFDFFSDAPEISSIDVVSPFVDGPIDTILVSVGGGDLDPETALDPTNYTLQRLDGDGNVVDTVELDTPYYSPEADTVVLHPEFTTGFFSSLDAGNYQLVVSGWVSESGLVMAPEIESFEVTTVIDPEGEIGGRDHLTLNPDAFAWNTRALETFVYDTLEQAQFAEEQLASEAFTRQLLTEVERILANGTGMPADLSALANERIQTLVEARMHDLGVESNEFVVIWSHDPDAEIYNLSPQVLSVLKDSVTPEVIRQLLEAMTPDLAGAFHSALTPEVFGQLFASGSSESLRNLTAGLTPETRELFWTAMPPELKQELWASLPPETLAGIVTSIPSDALQRIIASVDGEDIQAFLDTLTDEHLSGLGDIFSPEFLAQAVAILPPELLQQVAQNLPQEIQDQIRNSLAPEMISDLVQHLTGADTFAFLGSLDPEVRDSLRVQIWGLMIEFLATAPEPVLQQIEALLPEGGVTGLWESIPAQVFASLAPILPLELVQLFQAAPPQDHFDLLRSLPLRDRLVILSALIETVPLSVANQILHAPAFDSVSNLIQQHGAAFVGGLQQSLSTEQLQGFWTSLPQEVIAGYMSSLPPELIRTYATAISPEMIQEMLEQLTVSDARNLLEVLPPESIGMVASLIPPHLLTNFLSELPPGIFQQVTELVTPETLGTIVSHLSPEVIQQLIASIPPELIQSLAEVLQPLIVQQISPEVTQTLSVLVGQETLEVLLSELNQQIIAALADPDLAGPGAAGAEAGSPAEAQTRALRAFLDAAIQQYFDQAINEFSDTGMVVDNGSASQVPNLWLAVLPIDPQGRYVTTTDNSFLVEGLSEDFRTADTFFADITAELAKFQAGTLYFGDNGIVETSVHDHYAHNGSPLTAPIQHLTGIDPYVDLINENVLRDFYATIDFGNHCKVNDYLLMWFDPVDFTLTDADGLTVGHTNGEHTEQTQNAFYSGDGFTELLIVPRVKAEQYQLRLVGVEGTFRAGANYVDASQSSGVNIQGNLASQAYVSGQFQFKTRAPDATTAADPRLGPIIQGLIRAPSSGEPVAAKGVPASSPNPMDRPVAPAPLLIPTVYVPDGEVPLLFDVSGESEREDENPVTDPDNQGLPVDVEADDALERASVQRNIENQWELRLEFKARDQRAIMEQSYRLIAEQSDGSQQVIELSSLSKVYDPTTRTLSYGVDSLPDGRLKLEPSQEAVSGLDDTGLVGAALLVSGAALWGRREQDLAPTGPTPPVD